MGIYAITNRVTGEQYVGSSKQPYARWEHHKKLLKHGYHHCYKLQVAWNTYGSDAFDFTIWEFVKEEKMLRSKEQQYIDMYNPSYNAYLNTGGLPRRARIKSYRNRWRRFAPFGQF